MVKTGLSDRKHKQNWLLVSVLRSLLSTHQAQGQGSSQEGLCKGSSAQSSGQPPPTATAGHKGQKWWYSASRSGSATYAAGGDMGAIRM